MSTIIAIKLPKRDMPCLAEASANIKRLEGVLCLVGLPRVELGLHAPEACILPSYASPSLSQNLSFYCDASSFAYFFSPKYSKYICDKKYATPRIRAKILRFDFQYKSN